VMKKRSRGNSTQINQKNFNNLPFYNPLTKKEKKKRKKEMFLEKKLLLPHF